MKIRLKILFFRTNIAEYCYPATVTKNHSLVSSIVGLPKKEETFGVEGTYAAALPTKRLKRSPIFDY